MHTRVLAREAQGRVQTDVQYHRDIDDFFFNKIQHDTAVVLIITQDERKKKKVEKKGRIVQFRCVLCVELCILAFSFSQNETKRNLHDLMCDDETRTVDNVIIRNGMEKRKSRKIYPFFFNTIGINEWWLR